MGVTVVWQYEIEANSSFTQAIQNIHQRLDDCGAQKEGNFKYESEVTTIIINVLKTLSNAVLVLQKYGQKIRKRFLYP